MFIKPAGVSPNVFDVFLGEGWNNWSRVRIDGEGNASPVGGIRLRGHFLTHVQNVICNIFYSDLRAKRKNASPN